MNTNLSNILVPILVTGVIVIGVLGAVSAIAILSFRPVLVPQPQIIEVPQISQVTQTESDELGGLIHTAREVFANGLKIGKGANEYSLFTSGSTLYFGTSSDATFSINMITGRITMRETNFVTSTLNWGGNFSAGDGNDFYIDTTNQRVAVGTSTPSYRLEVVDGSDAVLAITATSTNDAIIRFNNGYQAAEWLVYMDNSDGDKFKIGTSSDLDLFVIDEYGRIGIGTSSPQTSLAIVEDNIDPTIRITSAGASEYDPKIEFRTDLGTSSLVMYVDDSDSDRIVFGTSTDLNLLTIDRWGNVAVLKGLAMATGTISGTLVVSGNTTLATTTVGRFVESGLVLATSSYGNGEITATEVCNGARINATIMVPTANLTLPSTSTLAADCLSAVGKSITFQIKNASTSSGLAQYTIVKGDGIDLRGTSTDNVHLDPTEIMEIKLFRETSATTTASQRLIRQAD